MLKVVMVLGVLVLSTAAAVPADEVKDPVGAALLLDNLLAPRAEPRDVAFDEALRQPGPPPRGIVGEVLPDGSVRYGKVTVSVKENCPPGHEFEPPPLPGRRARR